MNESVYEEVRKKSLPLIKHYSSDLLKHDKRSIKESRGCPFLHFTGRYGTSLVLLSNSDLYPEEGVEVPYLFSRADRNGILEGKVSTVDCMPSSGRQDLILHFDGKVLSEITQDKALRIVRAYRDHILSEWRG